jgi:hypothetical protein
MKGRSGRLLTTDAISSSLWQWDARTSRYRSGETGRFINAHQLKSLQERNIELIGANIQQLGDLLIQDQITLKAWQESTMQALKTLRLHQMVLAKGGLKQTFAVDYLSVGRSLKEDYTYLRSFAEDIQRGYTIGKDGQQKPITIKQFQARLNLYVQKGRTSFEHGSQARKLEQGDRYMYRTLGFTDRHCADCVRYQAAGVVSIGVLPVPGENCQCGGNCRCSVFYVRSLEDLVN